MAHTHPVYDTDKHFIIDPITKKITTECQKLALPQHSHKSERITFEIPKEVEGHDMSLCNVVEIHFQNIDATNKINKSVGICKAEDLKTEGDTVYGSWLIDGEATRYAGGLIFALHFSCVENGELEYNLPTLSYSGITVGATVWNSETIANEHPDIIAEFEARIQALEKGGASDEQIAQAVNNYLQENPVQAGATTEQAAQIKQNKEDIEKLATDMVDNDQLLNAVNDALAQAKASGEFDGDILVVTVENPIGNTVASHTASEIKAASNEGKAVFLKADCKVYPCVSLNGSSAKFELKSIKTNTDANGRKESTLTTIAYTVGEDATATMVMTMETLETDPSAIVPGGGTVTDEQIAEAVEAYLKDNPITSGGLDATIDGETLVFAESSTATIENETLIL